MTPRFLHDEYFYMRDDSRKDTQVLSHLRAENEYSAGKMAHLAPLRETLYNELLSHVQETDMAVPYPHGDTYHYYRKTVKGASYAIYCRSSVAGGEEIILDVNELAIGHSHCDVGSLSPSPDHTMLAYTVDFKGDETYSAYFKSLVSSSPVSNSTVPATHTTDMEATIIQHMSGRLTWGRDTSTVFYSTMDEAHRVNRVFRHTFGASNGPDTCLYREDDEVFSACFGKTRSARFIIVGSSSSETDEFYFIDLEAGPDAPLTLLQQRIPGVQYSVDHHAHHFYLVTNRDGAINFKLMKTPVAAPEGEYWTEVMPYNPNMKLDDASCFKNHLVLSGREDGLTQIWIMSMTSGTDKESSLLVRLCFEEPLYSVGVSVNKQFDTQELRITFSSLTTPTSTYDVNMSTQKKVLLKEQPCPNYDRSLYASQQIFCPSADGSTTIPMSMVYRKDKRTAGAPTPVHLYGYGSYEICVDPDFRSTVLPLLDHGVVYVIAHIRGGGEMGRSWYEDAKYLSKIKTFEDFISCADHLIATGVTTSELMTCEGRSAGGLLMGAVLNMRPDLFKAAIAGVPFVDVMNSMCDSSIPLTTGEWEEWGNPNEEKYFEYMLSYSPYENVRPQAYPNLLVTSGLYDPRVAYWEPTKWVAKLRDANTNTSSEILLKMDLDSGHFSASDRYHYLREKAVDIAYILDQLNLAPISTPHTPSPSL